MFVYLYRASPTITRALLEHVIESTPIYGNRQSWVSSDRQRGAVWSPNCLVTGSGQTVPRSDEPFSLAVGRLDRTAGLRAESLRQPADSGRIAAHVAFAGQTGISDLYGDFALASAAGTKLLIATDHVGAKRIFYTRTPEGYAVSSDLVALLSLPDTPKALNEDGLALLALAHVESGSGATCFREIKLLPGGHALMLEPAANSPQIPTRWWHPPGKPSRYYRRPEDYAPELELLFDNAVRSRLPAEGPVASTLSGGLDSTLVTAFAAKALAEQGRTLCCWTSVPHSTLALDKRPGWDSDDWPYASQLATRYANIEHEEVRSDGVCLLDVFDAINTSSGTPVRNSANSYWITEIAKRAQARGCTAMLNGQHGNASISYGGNGGLSRLIRQGRWLRFAKHIINLPGRRSHHALTGLLAAVVGGRGLDRVRALLGTTQQPKDLSSLMLMQPAVRDLYVSLEACPRVLFDSADRFKFSTRTFSPFAANIEAHASVNWVDPTSDRQLIEYLLDCPPEAFLDNGFERWQARQLGAGRVPDSIRWRRTRGEQMPEQAALFALYPRRYRAAWTEAREHKWFAKCVELDEADSVLESLIAGKEVPRPMAAAMFRLLNIGMFIQHTERQWQGQTVSASIAST
jgi:asparagine synthase (glutamine-hydrolysing)